MKKKLPLLVGGGILVYLLISKGAGAAKAAMTRPPGVGDSDVHIWEGLLAPGFVPSSAVSSMVRKRPELGWLSTYLTTEDLMGGSLVRK